MLQRKSATGHATTPLLAGAQPGARCTSQASHSWGRTGRRVMTAAAIGVSLVTCACALAWLMILSHQGRPYSLLPPRRLLLPAAGQQEVHAPPAQEAHGRALEPQPHHIFAGGCSSKGARTAAVPDPCSLQACPSSWIPGTWSRPSAVRGPGAALPLTQQAQRAIWDHQHPADCSKARFLVAPAPVSGFGSVIHVMTVHLQAALDSGRVFVEQPGTFMTATPYCGVNTTLDSCYFEPFSSCPPLSAQEMQAAPVAADLSQLMAADGPRVMRLTGALAALRPNPPERFKPLLQQTNIPQKNWHYWWRAQGASYIVRPNADSLAQLTRRRRERARGAAPAPGCIGLYVRHGDKWMEAEVFPDAAYEERLLHARAQLPQLTNQVVLCTDDPGTVQHFTDESSPWRTTHLDMARTADKGGPPLIDGAWTSIVSRSASSIQNMHDHGYAEEVLNVLTCYDMALECDAFVSTIYSNSARLIDELRSTVRCKADAPFWDVHYHNSSDIDFNW